MTRNNVLILPIYAKNSHPLIIEITKIMSRVCKLTGKRPLRGNRVSKSNIKTNRFQYPNLQKKKIFVPELNKSVTIKLSVKAMKIVDKLGLLPYLKKQGLTLTDIS